MAPKYKPYSSQTINVSTDKISHLLLRKIGQNFPKVAADPTNPSVGDICSATVRDDANDFDFQATPIFQGNANQKRLALRVKSKWPAGGAGEPTEGLISITLNVAIVEGDPTQTIPLNVADAPVDYITDAGAP